MRLQVASFRLQVALRASQGEEGSLALGLQAFQDCLPGEPSHISQKSEATMDPKIALGLDLLKVAHSCRPLWSLKYV